MGEREGVIKYRLEFTPGPPPGNDDLGELIAWHQILQRLGLVGRDPARYDGLAYGNLSRRLGGDGFVISASQTADRSIPTPQDYAVVSGWRCEENLVVASGPARPSSESLTHAALYDVDPAIGCVLHVHSPVIWERRDELGVPSTSDEVAYGTPAMARETEDIYLERHLAARGSLAMGGHRDGIVSFGHDVDEAGTEILLLLRRALTPPG